MNRIYLGSTLISPRVLRTQTVNARRASSTDATPDWVSVTPHATAHAKGAWTEIVAATSADIDELLLIWLDPTSGSTLANNRLCDIGVGAAGSEVVLVANIAMMHASNAGINGVSIPVPVAVAAGTRISVRLQQGRAAAAAVSMQCLTKRYPSGTVRSPVSVDTLGANTATTSGVALGTTSGAWVEVTPSTSRDYQGFTICPTSSDATMSGQVVAFDVGVGAAGSEVASLSDSFLSATSTELAVLYGGSLFVPVVVPAGSRVAVRVVDASITANAGWSVTLLGVPS